MELLSCVRLFVIPWTVAYHAPLSMEFSRQSIGVGCHFLLQGIYPIQGLNPGLPHCRQTLYHLSHQGSPAFSRGALLGVYTDLPMPRDTQGPCEGSDPKWAKFVDWIFLSQSAFLGLFDHFIVAWEIKTTNLICHFIDFQGTCDPCCYYVLLLRAHVWKCLALLD